MAPGGPPRLFRKWEISALPPGNSSLEPGGEIDEDSMPMQLAWLPASANVIVGEVVREANKNKSDTVAPTTTITAMRRISTSLRDVERRVRTRQPIAALLVMLSEALLS